MCGIVGTLGWGRPTEIQKFMKHGLFIDTLRGFDSTGIACINKDHKPLVLKSLLSGYDFVQTQRFDKIVSGLHTLYIGHNRAATRGTVNVDNAHPFEQNPVTLVHNGTLDSWNKLSKEYFTSDSQAIAQGLAEVEEAEAIPEFLESIHGAFALAWYDERTNLFNLARNDKRPMVVAWVDKLDQIVFGSEELILRLAADRAGWDLVDIQEQPPGEHWTMSMDKEGFDKGFEYVSFEYKRPVQTNSNYWNSSYVGRDDKTIPFSVDDKVIVTIPDYGIQPFITGNKTQGSTDLLIDGHEELAAKSWFHNREDYQGFFQAKKAGAKFVGIISQVSPQAGNIYIKQIKVGTAKEIKAAVNFDPKKHSNSNKQYVMGYNKQMLRVETARKFLASGCYHCGTPIELSDKFTWIKTDAALCEECHNPVPVTGTNIVPING